MLIFTCTTNVNHRQLYVRATLLASLNTALSAGYVIKIVLVPDDQSTLLLELELASIVV